MVHSSNIVQMCETVHSSDLVQISERTNKQNLFCEIMHNSNIVQITDKVHSGDKVQICETVQINNRVKQSRKGHGKTAFDFKKTFLCDKAMSLEFRKITILSYI